MIGEGLQATTMSRLRLFLAISALLAATGVAADESATVLESPGVTGRRMPLHTVIPPYPDKARRARVEGEVQVCFDVDREGKTHWVRVRKSTNRVFEKPSRDAVRASTYRRLHDDQRLSGIKTCRTFRFYLSPVAAIEKPE